jgi:hypothetical protein
VRRPRMDLRVPIAPSEGAAPKTEFSPAEHSVPAGSASHSRQLRSSGHVRLTSRTVDLVRGKAALASQMQRKEYKPGEVIVAR